MPAILPTTAERLLTVARGPLEELRTHPLVVGAMITGSVARGECDRHSDVDCSVYLKDAPGQEFFDEQKRLAIESGGDFYHGSPEEGFAVFRVVEGVKVDLGFGPCSQIDEIINAVYDQSDLELTYQLIIDGVRRCIPIFGEEMVEAWKLKTDVYPEALAEAMVRKHLRFRARSILEGMGADRGDFLLLAEEFLELQKNILGVLYGLNRAWHPGKLKGSFLHDEALKLAPERLGERFRALFDRDLHAACRISRGLVEETISLVEQHMPSIETAPVRARYGKTYTNPFG